MSEKTPNPLEIIFGNLSEDQELLHARRNSPYNPQAWKNMRVGKIGKKRQKTNHLREAIREAVNHFENQQPASVKKLDRGLLAEVIQRVFYEKTDVQKIVEEELASGKGYCWIMNQMRWIENILLYYNPKNRQKIIVRFQCVNHQISQNPVIGTTGGIFLTPELETTKEYMAQKIDRIQKIKKTAGRGPNKRAENVIIDFSSI